MGYFFVSKRVLTKTAKEQAYCVVWKCFPRVCLRLRVILQESQDRSYGVRNARLQLV